MKLKYLLILIPLLFSQAIFGQCTFFASANIGYLDDFIHDGVYTSLQTFPGQSIQIYKTVYPGQTYRMTVNAQKELGRIEIKVYDDGKQLIYSDNDDSINKFWDFTVESTINILIVLNCPYASGSQNGCVSVLFGFKEDKNPVNN